MQNLHRVDCSILHYIQKISDYFLENKNKLKNKVVLFK